MLRSLAGMCKRHYKEEQSTANKAPAGESPDDGLQHQEGNNGDAPPKKARAVVSVYEHILPNSIRWNPLRLGPSSVATGTAATDAAAAATTARKAKGGTKPSQNGNAGAAAEGEAGESTAADPSGREDAAASAALGRYEEVMPLVSYLKRGRKKPFGWHRRDERIAMDANPVPVKAQMEAWERRLVRFARVCAPLRRACAIQNAILILSRRPCRLSWRSCC